MHSALFLLARTLHVILLGLFWFLFTNLGILAAIFRHKPWGFKVHAFLGLVVVALTFVLGIGILPANLSNRDPLVDVHIKIGITVLAILAAQTLSGVLMFCLRKASRAPLALFYLRKGHMACGYFVSAFAKIGALLQYYEHYFPVFIALVVTEPLFWLIIAKLKFGARFLSGVSLFAEAQETPIITSLKAMKTAKEEYFLFRNSVFLMGSLLDTHPGGAQFIKALHGQQADRYLLGMYAHEAHPSLRSPVHTEDALRLLPPPAATLHIPSPFEGDSLTGEYSLHYIKVVSEKGSIYELYFRPKSGPPLKFRGYSQVSQLGRHRTVTLDGVSRLYTAANFLAKRNVLLMKSCLPDWSESIFSKLYLNESPRSSFIENERLEFLSPDFDDIPLLLRVYPTGSLTPKIINLQEKHSVSISGYEGPGLMLQDLEPGLVVLVSGGTGVFCFCDLIDLLYKAHLLGSAHPRSPEILAQNPILSTKCFQGFTFALMAAFEVEEDIPSLILQQLEALSTTKWFKATLRIKSVGAAKAPSKILRTTEDFTVAIEKLLESPF